jgi:DNA-binding CsgD family transcriptional regulator
MADVGQLDEVTKAALARLTEREKDCLRRWLEHQTAKEMALDLGISPFAVEKRLKMARAKLGATSSLDAARLLAAAEGYGRLGPEPPDLATGDPLSHKGLPGPLVLAGGICMSLAAIALIALATPRLSPGDAFASAGSAAPSAPVKVTVLPPPDALPPAKHIPPGFVDATPAEILVVIQSTFQRFDKDHSGYLEGEESPMVVSEEGNPVYRRDEHGNVVRTGEVVHQTIEELRAHFYAAADQDRDGKVSLAEFRRWDAPNVARQGIPAEWQADIERPVSGDTADPG